MFRQSARALRTFLFGLCLAAIPLGSTSSLNLGSFANVGVLIPFADAGTDTSAYTVGFGGNLAAELAIFDFFSAGVNFGVDVVPIRATTSRLSLTQVGPFVAGTWFPDSRIKLKAMLGTGFFFTAVDPPAGKKSFVNNYFMAGVSGGFRFSPVLTAGLGVNYATYFTGDTTLPSLVSGIHVTANVELDISALLANTASLQVQPEKQNPVFPILFTSYNKTPFAQVKLVNEEKAEIRNVEVRFQAGRFTSGSKLCATIPLIQRGQSVDIQLTAAFNDQVLGIIENTKVEGELLVTYSLIDAPKTFKTAVVVPINNRNALSWTDNRIIATLVSPTDTSLLEFTKFVAGLVRNRVRPSIDKNLQYGLGLFEALRVNNVSWAPDPNTPYQAFHADPNQVDYVQYPFQTLAYRSGDSDDLAVLYAAGLMSVGLSAAIITYDTDAEVAFKLGLDEATAKATFANPNLLIYIDGEAWLPVNLTRIKEGFLDAWQSGAEAWNRADKSKIKLNKLDDSWTLFPAVGVSSDTSTGAKPADEAVAQAFESTMRKFVLAEVKPRADQMKAEMASGPTVPRQHNSLGLLYAKYGMYNEARTEFEQAADKDYVPALINLGNIALLEKRFKDARDVFGKALSLQAENRAAATGLEQAKTGLEEYAPIQ